MIYHNSPKTHLNNNLGRLSTSATIAIQQLCRQLQQEGKTIYRLGLGQSPFPVPAPVVRALQENAHQKDYLAVKGLEELRRTLAASHCASYGIGCDIEDVIIGPGSKELMFILQLVYDGEILIPIPAWVSYAPQARIIGRHVNNIVTEKKDRWKVTAEQIDSICRLDPGRSRMLILNYPSNPTGQTYDANELEELAEVVSKYQVLVLSDEIYARMTFSGKHTSIIDYYPEGTIFSGGLSKWCGAGGWRLGLFIVPEAMRWITNAMATVASETFTSTSAPIQYAAIAAFEENPEIDIYVDRCRRILGALAGDITRRLAKTDIDVIPAQGGFYIFPDFGNYRLRLEKRHIFTSAELCDELLHETGVAILPGSDFGRPVTELTARLAFVDFDGEKALRDYPGDDGLDQSYLATCCTNTLTGIERIIEWLGALDE
ncbi:pyridoxal phosphate-dependent aminotransferase [Desulfopila inferna]|uniref:pyridoxal phosphate-dependent aminotransferase n=1 Tax=Desulfopila inferna TaxID=468528 RepID=UPI0019656503|nr:aminotransferase class I/II-fold pyridoxal phosphate-dependent enzyme [Desulfopila inferna]MBM9604040.1 aminotransferase class I/II-fold pyridoxal phosphate-dependent enzyme [Desulfopila inferna]